MEYVHPIQKPENQLLVLNTKRSFAMDRAISASEANQRFSEMLREVGQGDSFVVMSRGRAVARAGAAPCLREHGLNVIAEGPVR